MKIVYNVKPNRATYEPCKFTFGKTYDVIADYTKRMSGQRVRDNGYIVKDDFGIECMLFSNEITITDTNKENTYVFENKI